MSLTITFLGGTKMKKYVLIGFFFFTTLLSGCATEQFPGQNLFLAQDAAMKYLRETIVNPSTFAVNTGVMARATSRDGKELSVLTCGDMWGEASTVSEKGYFLTNDHVINDSGMEKECRTQAAEFLAKEKIDVSLDDIKVFYEYVLVGADGSKIPVTRVKTWAPDIDLAMFHVIEKTGKSFKSVVFSDALSFSDEAVAAIGNPLSLKDSIILGKILSPQVVKSGEKGESLMFNAGVEEGNSGGLLVSLSDMKVVGVVTRVIPVKGTMTPTPYAGAIPVWVIKEALKEVNME
jgi:S1-C subfamily serine protease